MLSFSFIVRLGLLISLGIFVFIFMNAIILHFFLIMPLSVWSISYPLLRCKNLGKTSTISPEKPSFVEGVQNAISVSLTNTGLPGFSFSPCISFRKSWFSGNFFLPSSELSINVNEPPWRWTLQPQSGLQMTKMPGHYKTLSQSGPRHITPRFLTYRGDERKLIVLSC